jgi:hypothetical protein
MSNRSPTPQGRSEIHTQPVNVEDPHSEADLDPPTPLQRKRHLDDEPYIPDKNSGAQSDAKGKTPKKRKTASSLPSYVKLNVIREAATVLGAPTEDARPRCIISGASDKMTVLEFSHVMSISTPSNEVRPFSGADVTLT